MEAWWWRRYLGGREPADYLAWKRAYWRDFLEGLDVDVADGSSVLDAGCGPAGVFTVLGGADVTALDPLLVEYARLPHFSPADYADVTFVATALEEFAPRRRWDVVFCLNVVNHVRDLGAVLRKLASATKEGGTVVLSVDAHRYRIARAAFRSVPGDVLHPHQLTLPEYEAAVADAGLAILRRRLVKREALFDYVALVCAPAAR